MTPRRLMQDRINEAVAEALAHITLDAGTYDDDDTAPTTVPTPASNVQKRGGGRPVVHDWPRIETVIDWYLCNRESLGLKEDAFIEAVRAWCRSMNKGKAPDVRAIEKRIAARANNRK
jgi:hypothetical protein